MWTSARNHAMQWTRGGVVGDSRARCREPLIAGVLSLLCRLRLEQSAWEICSRFRLQRVLEIGRDVWGRAQTVWARAAAESPAASRDLMRFPAARGVAALSCGPCMIPRLGVAR
jgi:hypothetical protein